ncbi:unnamed protein product [Ceratitis capitata]|uniref:(Mediterranean fruit fly) hypothetical protein n=1 Tax=Ceratitis capitata TaxID=7213 RepID=A0A811U2M0_CERCA|nr:unnamed protein product [Ceratitis capitata]
MADDTNEDSWLYGTSNPDSTTNEENVDNTAGLGNEKPPLSQKSENEATALGGGSDNIVSKDNVSPNEDETFGEFEDPAQEMEEDEEAAAAAASTAADTTDGGDDTGDDARQSKSPEDGEGNTYDEDDSDDDINVVIGDIKAAPNTYNIKQRANLLVGPPGSGQEKAKSGAPGGKFSVEDFEGVGTINGVPAHEFSIDSLEDKPWRKPGADITDYFNYGFNEETWRSYCERQKRFRIQESGVGLASLTQNMNQSAERQQEGQPNAGPISIVAPGSMPDQMQLPPPGILPPPQGVHHVPSRMGMGIPRGPRPISTTNSKENPIQVMTAECREYSRPGSMPQMPPNFGGPPPNDEPYFPEPETFDYGYEPTQESQWNNENPVWVPSGIKELTPGPVMVPPPSAGMSGPPGVPPMGVPPPQIGGPPPQMRQHPPLLPAMHPPNMGNYPL